MEIVYRARDITEAHIVCGMLEANGIEAHVGGFYLQGGVGELATMDFATIQVDEAQLGRARKLVEEYEGSAATPGSVERSGHPGASAGWILAVVVALLLAALYLIVGLK